jgi:hypothetical protein
MSEAWDELSDEDIEDEYGSELDDVDFTSNTPRFVKMELLSFDGAKLASMRVDELIKTYIEARNQLGTDRKGYKAREKAVKEHLAMISMALKEKAEPLGVDNFKTELGTAYKNKKETFKVSNWEELVKYLQDTNNFHVLQKRVSPLAVKDIRTIDGAIPPGVEGFTMIEFAVRSPTSRKPKVG